MKMETPLVESDDAVAEVQAAIDDLPSLAAGEVVAGRGPEIGDEVSFTLAGKRFCYTVKPSPPTPWDQA